MRIEYGCGRVYGQFWWIRIVQSGIASAQGCYLDDPVSAAIASGIYADKPLNQVSLGDTFQVSILIASDYE